MPPLLPNSAIGSLIYNETDEIIEVRSPSGWKSLETLTTLVDNEDGTYTFTNERGESQIITIATEPPTLELTKTAIGYNFAAGHTAQNGTALYAVNSTVSRTATGLYTVTFNSAHPNGNQYPITLGVQEDPGNGEARIIQVVTGSQTDMGFQIKIVRGDNGVTADVPDDEIWYFNVVAEIEVVNDVVIPSNSSGGGGIPQGTPTTSFSLNNFGDRGAFQLNFNAGSNPGATWEALISNRPYNSLPANTVATINGSPINFTTSTNDNGDGTFNILIVGESPLPDFNPSLTISSPSTTTPPGTQFGGPCSCVTFYLN